MHNQRIGKRGEAIAAAYLRQRGYTILVTNYRNRLGEIDLIAKKEDTLLFIEVKTRTNTNFGLPYESISNKKMKRIRNVALCYMKETNQTQVNIRMDVISILLTKQGNSIEWLENAF